MPQYAYSLNGENWMGSFSKRDAALAAAIQKCSGASDPPGTVFVGEVAAGEAMADGLGKILIQEMRRRATARGVEGAGQYLRDVSGSHLKDLDSQIEKVVANWLQKNRWTPESIKVEAISEHSVPMSHMALRN